MLLFDALERKVLVASGFQGEGAFSRRLARAFSGSEFALAALREHFLDQDLLSQCCESLFLIGISSRNPARAFLGLALGSRSTVRAFSGLGFSSHNSASIAIGVISFPSALF